jgi:hypothetical protein
MSLAWDGEYWRRPRPQNITGIFEAPPARAVDLDTRPAGDGPLMQEFYARVAGEMREQERANNENMQRVMSTHREMDEDRATRNRARRIALRTLAWFAMGFASGAMGAMIVHWIR